MTSTCTATALESASAKRVLTQQAVQRHLASAAADTAAASHHGAAQIAVAPPQAGASTRVQGAILSLKLGGA